MNPGEFKKWLDKQNGTRSSTFPEAWGQPLGDRDSELRAEWVKSNVVRHLPGGAGPRRVLKELLERRNPPG